MSASLVKDYEGTTVSGVLGDVQRLPGGNTLITYSKLPHHRGVRC